MGFKRELQTVNVTARPWSRDILRFAVSHEKPDGLMASDPKPIEARGIIVK